MRALLLAALLILLFPGPMRAEPTNPVLIADKLVAACRKEPITVSTPSGIAGCVRWGDGIASHYGPGNGVAMNFCTFEVRHTRGCGWVRITSSDTGRTVTAPVVDFCDCWTHSSDERIVDLQYGVLAALGLDRARGLYRVHVQPATSSPPTGSTTPTRLPDTAMR